MQTLSVELLDGLLRRLVGLELDEGEAARTSRFPVGGHLDVHDPPGDAKGLEDFLARGVEAQVTHEDLVRNGRSP